jgi:hypothetical protein
MTQRSIINEVRAGGEEIYEIVGLIERACEGVSRANLEIACIAIALTLQYPDISPEDRFEGVQDISRYICLWLDSKLDKDNLTVN